MHLEITQVAPYYEIALPLLGLGIIAAGIAILRHPDAVAQFFRRGAEPMYGQRMSAKLYTAKGIRVAGAGYVGFGCLLIVVSVGNLIARQVSSG